MNERERYEGGVAGLADDMSRHPVTATTVVAAVLISIAYWTDYDLEPLFMSREALTTQPWRLVTSAFPHGDFIHLLFNVYWTWRFGRIIEGRLGSLRTAAIYILLAAGSSAAEYALFDGGIGLSGVVYGLFGLLWVLDRRDPSFRGTVDPQVTMLFIGWFFFCIFMTAIGAWRIANVAHGAGAGLGVLLGRTMSAAPGRQRRWRAAVVAALAGIWLLGTVGREHVNLGSGLADDYFQRGYDAHIAGDAAAAEAYYRKALELEPRKTATISNLALALADQDRLEEALVEFERVLQIDPQDDEARYKMAGVLNDLDRHADALELLERALEGNADDALVLARMGWTKARTGDYEGALVALDKSLARNPNSSHVHAWRGWALGELERFDGALAAFDRASELDPASVHSLVSRCWVLLELGQFEQAVTACDAVLELDPENEQALACREIAVGER